MDNAIDGLERLINHIGSGDVVARCVVDQPYAHIQHENLTYRHIHGGGAKYLEQPLYENITLIREIIATHLIEDIIVGMIKVAEMMSEFVEQNAPIDIGVHELRNSGHPSVTDNGVIIYDRLPRVKRVNDD